MTQRIVVTGAGRGLGLEFTRQWLNSEQRVFALVRDPDTAPLVELGSKHPESLTRVGCNVTEDGSVAASAAEVAKHVDGIELVLNNAGTMGVRGGVDALNIEDARRVFDINALGPLRVSRAFLPLLQRGNQPRRLVHMTSLMGSIADNQSGGGYSYRMSKAALNMASRSLAVDLADEGIVSAVLHPGWVQTDMGGSQAPLPASDAVAEMIQTIDSFDASASGRFFDRQGEELPW